ncbi:hypothetical protein NHX12_029443 [Muraenolepis orangiensis]|uniref:Uncharacterized protein n=1 Tax=Muraenolepis orangiensis TaxID=630683 RepID=A0A9Q0EE38_9TELE|nr:hypothetical protein NHX12_029443 [Muraenolepis orangiensis]
MSTPQLFQQMAFLNWLSSQSDSDREALMTLTGIGVAKELYMRLTGQDRVDAFKSECIQSIADFVRMHPQASEAALSAEVNKNVLLFAARVKALESMPIL